MPTSPKTMKIARPAKIEMDAVFVLLGAGVGLGVGRCSAAPVQASHMPTRFGHPGFVGWQGVGAGAGVGFEVGWGVGCGVGFGDGCFVGGDGAAGVGGGVLAKVKSSVLSA